MAGCNFCVKLGNEASITPAHQAALSRRRVALEAVSIDAGTHARL